VTPYRVAVVGCVVALVAMLLSFGLCGFDFRNVVRGGTAVDYGTKLFLVSLVVLSVCAVTALASRVKRGDKDEQ